MASNRRWRLQFRCRGSRRKSAVAQLFSLGIMRTLQTSITAMLLAVGCQAEPVDAVKEFGPEFFAVGNAWYHTAQTFYTQSGRWPTNFVEFASIAKQSDPLFDPSHYKNIEFTVRPDGELKIDYQRQNGGGGEVVVDQPQKPKATK
jgi:hypothetical protein